jgi:hypothetical protein
LQQVIEEIGDQERLIEEVSLGASTEEGRDEGLPSQAEET